LFSPSRNWSKDLLLEIALHFIRYLNGYFLPDFTQIEKEKANEATRVPDPSSHFWSSKKAK